MSVQTSDNKCNSYEFSLKRKSQKWRKTSPKLPTPGRQNGNLIYKGPQGSFYSYNNFLEVEYSGKKQNKNKGKLVQRPICLMAENQLTSQGINFLINKIKRVTK